ncbi:PAS domain S-box protein [Propionispora sp. 2/2-37]|uniref:PAS domain S-box protein n=1 Tax=Propionispora sp. 2/2-37 TaxID=1677858 RepID=UPI00155DCA87|nr:PAS domain S-box protein [Propionispora sp. 2/2-37]
MLRKRQSRLLNRIRALQNELSKITRMQKAYEQESCRLQTIAEITKAGIWDWDVVNQVFYHNSRWKEIFGYESHEQIVIPDDWSIYCHPAEKESLQRIQEEHLQGNTDFFKMDFRLKQRDHSYRWVRVCSRAFFYQHKQPVRWIGAIVDIHDSKMREKWTKERKSLLKDFVSAISDAGYIFDESGNCVENFSNRKERLPFCESREGDKTIFDIIPSAQAKQIYENISRVIATQTTGRFTLNINLPAVGRRTFIIRITPMDYQTGGKKTVAMILLDVTEQEKSRYMLQVAYEARRRSELLNEFLYEEHSVTEEKMVHASNMGLEFTGFLFCLVITIEVQNKDFLNHGGTYIDIQAIKDEIIDDLQGINGCTTWRNRNQIGVLCRITALDQPFVNSTMELAQYIKQRIGDHHEDLRVTIGVGEIHNGLAGFRESFQQALEANMASSCVEGNGEIIHYKDLGILQLFLDQGTRSRTAAFVRDTIGKLIKYDTDKGTDYLTTLEMILQSQSLKETANRLFLHHNTVVFRKHRIEAILGVSISHFETKLTLATAIKLYRLNLPK